jgi:Rps23 Pro-64 3,4-dihydroxylase Tpa1-like proline 4-hydroxylase
MLNPRLNITALSRIFAQHGVVSIRNILAPDVAERLHKAIASLPWRLEIADYRSDKKLRRRMDDMTPRHHLLATLDWEPHALDVENLFYMRLCCDTSEMDEPYLKEFVSWMNSEEFLSLMGKLTGRMDIAHTWVEATCYDSGCFLGSHRDDHHPGNLVALVLNLTPVWQLDWGGLLMLRLHENSPPVIIPTMWNSLNLFNVPVDHFVSAVSPAARGQRLALTGWLRP